ADGGQIDVCFGAVREERRAGPEERRLGVGDEAPERRPVRLVLWPRRTAVEDAAGGAVEQRAHLAIPHDPAGRAVPVEALAKRVRLVAAADVVMEGKQLQRDDDDAAMAMHYRLRQSGRAAGVHDPERVVEWQPDRLEGVDGRIFAGKDR